MTLQPAEGWLAVFPARAGMIRPHGPHPTIWERIPRESGDDPIFLAVSAIPLAYSPRERG